MILKTVNDYLSQGDNFKDIRQKIETRERVSREDYDHVFSNQRFIDTLINDYREHGNLIVAFDFDDTVEPSNPKFPCDLVIELLQVCSQLGFVMICFTARTLHSDMEMIRDRCKSLGIKCDYINEDADSTKDAWKFEHDHKIFYNIFWTTGPG